MADYTNLKVPEIKKLLQERGLPVSGNKAELIARLQENDTSGGQPAAAAGTAIAPPAEEEIDWDDDDATAEATTAAGTAKPTSDAAAAALAAGGQGQVANPAAVPNQKIDVDPAETSDLTATKPAAYGTASKAEVTAPAALAETNATSETAEAKASTPAAPAVDFTSGVAATALDEEIRKRQARAKRFNVEESEGDAIRALERAKRFGTGTADEQAAAGNAPQSSEDGKAFKGLDQALPERRPARKRGRDDGNDAEGGGKRRDVAGRGGRGRRPGRGGGGGGGGQPRIDRSSRSGSRPQQGGRIRDDPVERAKLEARAKKFASPSAA